MKERKILLFTQSAMGNIQNHDLTGLQQK